MKNYFLPLLFLMLGTSILYGQKAEKVLRITESQQSGEYYRVQAGAWKKELEKNEGNADAWLNYFTAARYSNIFNEGPQFDLEKIVTDAGKAVPNTFEAVYLKFWLKPWDENAFGHLQKAYSLDPLRTETYHEFMTHYLRKGDFPRYNEFCKKHYVSVANSPGFNSWNYNALVNLDENAILLTEGDNDTYPAWILQEAKNFRKDIAVVNTNLIMSEDYRALIFKQLKLPELNKDQNQMERDAFRLAMIEHLLKNSSRPIYFGIGMRESMRNEFEENLYLVGLSFKYSKTAIDEVAILRKSYENDFRWDHLKMPLATDPRQVEIDRFSRSYLPGLMKVYNDYRKKEERAKAKELKNLILTIGEKSNSLEETKKILAKY